MKDALIKAFESKRDSLPDDNKIKDIIDKKLKTLKDGDSTISK